MAQATKKVKVSPYVRDTNDASSGIEENYPSGAKAKIVLGIIVIQME